MTKQRLLQHLQRTAGSCRAVAFDVFDTLLYRDVAAPADLFALMERTGRARPGFAAARRNCRRRQNPYNKADDKQQTSYGSFRFHGLPSCLLLHTF